MKNILLFLLFPFVSFSQTTVEKVETLLEQKNYNQAEIPIKPVVSENPNDVKSIEMLGDAYGYQEKWDAAIIQYKRLTELNPENANYYYKYGGALGMKALEINKFSAFFIVDDIEEAFLKAAKLDTKHINTRWALVEFYMQLPGIIGGSVKNSMKYANELEQLSKVDGYLAKGYIYEYDDEPELAEKHYKMAITEGGSLTCYNKLTTLYQKQEQPEKAIQNIEASYKEHERNALHYQIGKVSAEYEIELDKGKSCLQVYIANYTPEDGVPTAWANYRLAQIYKHQGQKNEALKHIDLAIEELPKIKPFKTERAKILSL